MDDNQKKQLKEILKSEFLPLFVGLRDELKTLNLLSTKILEKEFPEVQKIEVTNTPEPTTEVAVSNLPDVQKVELTNPPEQRKSVQVSNLETAFEKHTETAKGFVATLVEKLKDIREGTMKVHVQNHQAFPKKIAISNLDEIVIPKAEPQTSIKISNSQPADAIPVILTTRDRKSFYNAMQQMYVANDVNLQKIVDAINDQTVTIDGEVNVDTDELEALVTTSNELLTDILNALGGGGDKIQEYGEAIIPTVTEVTLCSFVVPATKTFNLRGLSCEGDADALFRLYVDASVVWKGRNAWTNRTVSLSLERAVLAGETVELTAENLHTASCNFSGTFYGEQI